jgi:MFS family permease
MTVVPLRRNRDFMFLQAGQLLSTTGTQSAVVAYPLLVLLVTNSPALAGLVGFTRVLPGVVFGVLGGAAADRFNRKLLLIVADAFRAVAVGGIALATILGRLEFWQILVAAFVEGSFSSLFGPAATAALRSVVPAGQLPAAVGVQRGRSAVASLAGPPLGGALFGLHRALPFVVDAVSYAFSVVAFVLIRKPFQEARESNRSRLRDDLAEGWRFLWGQPFLRTTTFLYGLTNFIGPGVLLAIVVVGERQGLPGGTIGVLFAAFSACLLAGSFASGFAHRVLSARVILLLELWAWPGILLFIIWPNVFVLAASILPVACCIPVTDSVVVSYRLAITPDRLVGRVESVRGTIALALSPFGSLTGGLLLSAMSARLALLAFAAVALVLALWGTLSPVVRNAPSLSELIASGGRGQAAPPGQADPSAAEA